MFSSKSFPPFTPFKFLLKALHDIGTVCFLAFSLCWSTFNIIIAYAKVKAESTSAKGSPLLFYKIFHSKVDLFPRAKNV